MCDHGSLSQYVTWVTWISIVSTIVLTLALVVSLLVTACGNDEPQKIA